MVGRHRVQLDGDRWVLVQLPVDHPAEQPAQGEDRHPHRRGGQPRRHRHHEPIAQRPGRLQPDLLGQGQAGHHGLGVVVLIGRVPGGSSVSRGPCRTCSDSTSSRRMPRPRTPAAGPRSAHPTAAPRGPAGGSTATPSQGRRPPAPPAPGCLGHRRAVAGPGQHHDGPGHLGVAGAGEAPARLNRPADLDQVGLGRARPLQGMSRATGRASGRPLMRGGWVEVGLADDLGAGGGNGGRAGYGLQAV
jgi:hypothetical protein